MKFIDPDGACDVLELPFAGVVKIGVELVAHLPIGVLGDADPAGLRDAFEPRCDIDPVAEDVALLDDNVADVNPDTDFDALLIRNADIALRHPVLHVDGAARGVHGADEFDQYAVAGAFDDTAAMLRDGRFEEFAAVGVEPGERAFLVGTHQPAVSRDIGGENRRKPPLHTLFGHIRRAPLGSMSLWLSARGVYRATRLGAAFSRPRKMAPWDASLSRIDLPTQAQRVTRRLR